MSLSWLVTLEVSAVQVLPPSVVARTVPLAPTAQQVLSSTHDTPYSAPVVPDDWIAQVEPSVVVRTVPLSPTATQCVSSTQSMARRIGRLAAPTGPWLDQLLPP